MFTIILNFFFFYYLSFISTTPISIYQNARFDPIDYRFLLANFSSISSRDACICQCLSNSICIIAAFQGFSHSCSLYFAQFYEGQLQLMTTDSMSDVICFRNKTISDTPFINMTNETGYGIWNTTAGENSVAATVGINIGNYNTGETPVGIFDGINTTNYCSFGNCNKSMTFVSCGEKTGFYVTIQSGPILLRAFRFRSGHYEEGRDPSTITLEGSNLARNYLTIGSSWTLIYNGSAGLTIDRGRSVFGETQTIVNNSIWYSSYRLLVTAKKGSGCCAEYSEVQFFGY